MAERPKRERKSVDHFKPTDGPLETKRLSISEGRGTKLGDIPNVRFKLSALKSGDAIIENLHALLYKGKGKALKRKSEVKSFSGFSLPEGDEEGETKKLEARLAKWTDARISELMTLLDIPKGKGDEAVKDRKVTRVIEFLIEPKVLSDTDLEAQAAAKKAKAAKAKTKKEEALKQTTKKPAARKSEGGSASKAAAAAKSPATKKKATPAKAPAKSPGKKGTPKKEAAEKAPKAAAKKGTPSKKRKADDADEEEAPAKRPKTDEKASKWPEDSIVTADVHALVKEANAQETDLTLTQIFGKLGEKYGLSVAEIKKKKTLIKGAVDSFTVSDAEGDEEGEDATNDKEAEATNDDKEVEEASEDKEADPEAADEAPAAEPEATKATETEATKTAEAPMPVEEAPTASKGEDADKEAAPENGAEPMDTDDKVEEPVQEPAGETAPAEVGPPATSPQKTPATEQAAGANESDALAEANTETAQAQEDEQETKTVETTV